jgi:uncharacterized protein with PIN domain
MAIKVIDEKPHRDVVKQAVCHGCGATLEYVPNDVMKDYSTDYTGGKDIYEFIRCPRCNHQARV